MTDDGMETPQISRSGRVLKKSAKVKEMEDFDITEIDVQGKARKKSKDFDDFDDKRVAPIKIPKISLMPGGSKKKPGETSGKQVFKQPFQGSMKVKQTPRQTIYQDSSDGSKDSDSNSESSETTTSSSSTTSSDSSDDEQQYVQRKTMNLNIQPPHQEKVIVEHQQQRYESPIFTMEPSSDITSEDSEDASSDAALVIAEDSDESPGFSGRGQKANARKRGTGRKDPTYAPKQNGPARKKAAPRAATTPAAKKKKPAARSKPMSAYMMWYNENQKKIAAASGGSMAFGNFNKKMGEAWKALPEKEKMVWRGKARRQAVKASGNTISTGSTGGQSKAASRSAAVVSEEILKSLADNTGVLGTAPIDAAAHMKLLGDSLTVIGQRLIEHEGQLAVSGIYSVLLDTLLCAIAPLLCLTTEVAGLENLDRDVFKRSLDHIAYFMPGL